MPDTQTRETLVKARELIAVPERWTQGKFARDERGVECSSTSPRATCWCALGAVNLASQSLEERSDAEYALERAISGIAADFDNVRAFTVFNDTHTHDEVLAAFDRAIASIPEAV